MRSTPLLSLDENSDAIIDFIANVPLFDSMERDEVDIAFRFMTILTFSAGEILFNEWDKGDYACFVMDGRLDVLKRSDAEHYSTVASLNRGKSIGELSIIEKFPRLVTLKARSNGTVVTFSREAFEALLKEHMEIGIKILKGLIGLLGHNLRKTSSRLSDYMLPMS